VAAGARAGTDVKALIRDVNRSSGIRTLVVDDDATGSQTVYGVDAVTSLESVEIEAALGSVGACCFVLTNSRSLPAPDAAVSNRRAGGIAAAAARSVGAPVSVVSRSDSTLRGHLFPEVLALDESRRAATGRGYDCILMAPAFIEAGRVTKADTHLVRTAHGLTPVSETEFARDPSFAYTTSDLREFVAEKSAGSVDAASVGSIGLDDIRLGGPERVSELLKASVQGRFVVVNGTEATDYDVVALAARRLEAEGQAILYRTAPSFVSSLIGLEPRAPVSSADLDRFARGPGLVVVGSHVGLTNRQLARLAGRPGLTEVVLNVDIVVDSRDREGHLRRVATEVCRALDGGGHVCLVTSRRRRTEEGAEANFAVSRSISAALSGVVASARSRAAWVVAKGGITSHDVALHGLGIRRARVMGQFLPGQISVLEPMSAPAEVLEKPYVVFPGNVGRESTLREIVDVLSGARDRCGDG
jgi:uncharacterized protein YgbK (DUF1537 family)